MMKQVGSILRTASSVRSLHQRRISGRLPRAQMQRPSREEEWLWPLTRQGAKYVELHRIGTMIALGTWSLETSQPIEPHHWNKAYMHVQRMCPIMRVKIRERDGQLWYCRDDYEGARIEIVRRGSNTTKEMMRSSLSWSKMEKEISSLCCFVVIPDAQDDSGFSSGTSSATHPHRYTLLQVFHHGLLDGFTAVHISNIFIATLNQVVAGNVVKDSVTKGEFLKLERMLKYKEIPLSNTGSPTITEENPNKEPVLLKGFPPPGGHNPVTQFIFSTLEGDALFAIKDACKREGVTFHSALMAAHQIATVDLLHTAGVNDDTATFCVNMSTDLRRYMLDNPRPVHGLHITRSKMFIQTKSTQDSGFWDFVRYIDKEKDQFLNSNDALLQMEAEAKTPPNSSSQTFDYSITGLRATETPADASVQLVGRALYVLVHNTSLMNYLCYVISKQRCTFTFSYASNFMKEETATLLMNRTFHVLERNAVRISEHMQSKI